jgi:hypothetical protein
MSNTPPLLPHETFARILRIARFDGLSVLGVAGIFALLAGAAHDYQGAFIGLAVALAGALELHGCGLLQHGYSRGMSWLIGSHLYLAVALLAYCAWRITHIDLGPLREAFHTALPPSLMQQITASNQELGLTEDQFLQRSYRLTYASLAVATLIYQGSMAVYYFRRRDAVAEALADE